MSETVLGEMNRLLEQKRIRSGGALEDWDYRVLTTVSEAVDRLSYVLKISYRKQRLFACACCRMMWALLADDRSREAIEIAEWYADGLATERELREARVHAFYATRARKSAAARAAHFVVHDSPTAARSFVTECMSSYNFSKEQCECLCDLLGKQADAVTVDPSWLLWREGTIPKLVEAAYEERQLPAGTLDNARLAVLADALEEAGCDNGEILGHFRSSANHWRGCHVLDALLGKE